MESIILHIDVNSAFLSWTAVDLINKGYHDIRDEYAVISGASNSRSGIVLAKSIKCKEKNIITGEPLYLARNKCPHLKTYQPDYKLYQEMSNKLFNYISRYTPDIEVFSIDECYVDYTKVKNLYGDVFAFATRLKDEIRSNLGFTVNIGIGNNKLCAKMASDFKKPDLVHTLYLDEFRDKVWSFEIDSLFGIGKKSSAILKSIGIYTIKDLALADYNILYKYFKNKTKDMIDSANGIDYSIVQSDFVMSKGMGNSITLEEDLEKIEDIYQVLEAISNNLGLSLHKEKRYAYVIAVQLKDHYFHTYSKQIKLKNATNITSEIYDVSKQLAKELWNGEPIRLVGIRLDHLVNSSDYQLSLFEDISIREDNSKLEETIIKIKEKYGEKIIDKASLKNNKIMKKY